MTLAELIAKVFAEETASASAVGRDYKDQASAMCDGLGDMVCGDPELEALIVDMPDAYSCPRAFWDWIAANASE